MSTCLFSFQNLFLNIGSGLSQIFLSRELILLGSKLDSLNIIDASNILIGSLLNEYETRIGEMICRNHGVEWLNFETTRYNTILNKYPYFVDYVKNKYMLEGNNNTVDRSKIDYTGIFDVLLENEANPVLTFLTIIGSSDQLVEILEPLITLSVSTLSVQKIKTFNNLIIATSTPFVKFILNLYGSIFAGMISNVDGITMKNIMDDVLNMIKTINKTIDDYKVKNN